MDNESNRYDTPTNIIKKEVDLYRGMLNSKKSLGLRIATITISFLIFLIPGSVLVVMGVVGLIYEHINKNPQILFVLFLGLLLIFVGVRVTISNLKSSKKVV